MERTYVNPEEAPGRGHTNLPTDLQTYSRTHAWSRRFLILGTLVLGLLAMTRTALAQTTTYRRVIHLWVDPINGVDTAPPVGNGAIQLNPGGVQGCGTETYPIDVIPSPGVPLLHASWPFKTIQAAVNYIPPLPHTSTVNSSYDWQYAIIHLMPGLYARSNAYAPNTHNPDNGQIPNGEPNFPIDIPDRVSIQGTSALNTLIDLGPANYDNTIGGGPAFRFGNQANSTGVGSFIDSVSITGAYPYQPTLSSTRAAARCSAIYLSPNFAAKPTISNCFLFGNGTGVLIDASPIAQGVVHDGVTLINNTIAMNYMGIWNGSVATTTAQTGRSKLILANNIFDSSPDKALTYPTNWISPLVFSATNPQCFEGVDRDDLHVAVVSKGWMDFNAYAANGTGTPNYNSGQAHAVVGLPAVAVRSNPPTGPGVDIAPYTGANKTQANIRRGSLYVRDVLANGPFQAATSTNFDMSPHDFRLSAAIAPATEDANQRPTAIAIGDTANGAVLNVLVNKGFSGGFPLSMRNGLSLTKAPGTLNLGDSTNQQTWAFDNWKHDCEGFGNSRIQAHSSSFFALITSPPQKGAIDIGADELGQLLAVGYRYGTTNFMKLTQELPWQNLPANVNTMDNGSCWFLGIPQSHWPTGFGIMPVRPFYRRINHLTGYPVRYEVTPTGGGAKWYDGPWFDSWKWTGSASYYQPKLVDTTPHLLPDFHPWWSTGTLAWASNPIWQLCSPWTSYYNVSLYMNPTVGVINPMGSYAGDATGSWAYQFLDGSWPSVPVASSLIQIFGWGSADGVHFRLDQAPVLPSYDTWGRAYKTVGQYRDIFPATFLGTNIRGLTNAYTALRYSIENQGGGTWTAQVSDTNLQNFMVIVEGID